MADSRVQIWLGALEAVHNTRHSFTMRNSMRLSFGVVAFFVAATATAQSAPNSLTAEEKAAGWKLLFDGKTTAGWRAYGADTMPSGWQVVDGVFTRVSRAADIITRDQYGDFELLLDWKLEPRGNSGLFYRAIEGLEWI